MYPVILISIGNIRLIHPTFLPLECNDYYADPTFQLSTRPVFLHTRAIVRPCMSRGGGEGEKKNWAHVRRKPVVSLSYMPSHRDSRVENQPWVGKHECITATFPIASACNKTAWDYSECMICSTHCPQRTETGLVIIIIRRRNRFHMFQVNEQMCKKYLTVSTNES